MSEKELTTQNNVKEAQAVGQAKPVYWSKPPVDIFENQDELVLIADLPGVAETDLQLQVEQGVLTLEAELEGRDENYRSGFYRQFKLSDRVDANAGKAALKDGVLTLRLPKTEAAKPKKIAVNRLH